MAAGTCHDLGNLSKEEFYEKYTIIERLHFDLYADIAVYKTLDRVKDQIVVIKLASNHEELDFEINTACNLQNFDLLRKYTDSLFKINEFGTRDDKIGFFVMPLYHGPIWRYKEFNYREELETVFELLLAVVVLNMSGIIHGDLHAGNIMYEKVQYKRQYTINGTKFLCISDTIPVVIDFGRSIMGSKLETINSKDANYLVNRVFLRIHDQIFKSLIPRLKRDKSFNILLNPIFQPLIDTSLEGGDLVKVFESFDI